jgi:hypothetical protein
VTNAPDLSRSDNRLLAALPLQTLALFGQDLKQVSLSQGIVVTRPVTGLIGSIFRSVE